ncbi:cilia- and flagella-associated protein 299 isoform X2 [Hemitrygon akajei]|uniref:cilia- and flagella-associated protein 299 isoform X2 n=1 Tax=Hemitrygon akajei TaxID=2704970 RepID=UPI003BF9BF86
MDDEEQGGAAVDNIVNEFETYESFLDSQITSLDMYYLEDEELARQLVELGYRGSGEVLKREEFEKRKATAEAARIAKKSQKKALASPGKELKDNFLLALAEREEDNRSGKMSESVWPWLNDSYRWQDADQLSFYNWDTQNSTSNSSPYYQVITDNASGLLFKNKRDRKVINVDPKGTPGDNTTRNLIETELYVQVVIYDHVTRRKT